MMPTPVLWSTRQLTIARREYSRRACAGNPEFDLSSKMDGGSQQFILMLIVERVTIDSLSDYRGQNTMFAIFFHALAKPGKRQELYDFLDRDSKFCKEREPRTIKFEVFQDPQNYDAFYVYEAYEDCAAFVEHQGNPPYKEWEPRLKNELVAEFTK